MICSAIAQLLITQFTFRTWTSNSFTVWLQLTGGQISQTHLYLYTSSTRKEIQTQNLLSGFHCSQDNMECVYICTHWTGRANITPTCTYLLQQERYRPNILPAYSACYSIHRKVTLNMCGFSCSRDDLGVWLHLLTLDLEGKFYSYIL